MADGAGERHSSRLPDWARPSRPVTVEPSRIADILVSRAYQRLVDARARKWRLSQLHRPDLHLLMGGTR